MARGTLAAERGFNNIFAKPLTAVNLGQLNVFEDGAVVDAAALTEKGIVTGFDNFVVVLSSDGKQQMIYKHAISTLVPAQPVRT